MDQFRDSLSSRVETPVVGVAANQVYTIDKMLKGEHNAICDRTICLLL